MTNFLLAGRTRRGARDDRGAAAVMFALCAVLLFGFGALAVDLGNMYQRKAETQSQADLAALSAAPYLKTSHAAAVDQVVDYLQHNGKLGEAALAGMTPGTLQDGVLDNGEVQFPSTYSMKVWTPHAHVDFGLANVFDSSGGDVASSATVGLGTPGANATMPFYAVGGSGCDYGTQTLSDPANGHVQSIVPPLALAGHDPAITSNATQVQATPYQFDVGVSGATITITGSRLAQVDRIGYFREATDTVSPLFAEAALGTANTNNNAVTGAPVPTAVTNVAGVWWVRVFKPAPGNWGWAPVSQALPIRIGDGPIACPGAANAGNFGALKLARDTGPSTWLPDNMAVGLELPLSLQANPLALPLCTPGGLNVIYTDSSGPQDSAHRYMNTNCVDTDTGLSAQVTTQGLVDGSGSNPGRLVKPTTTAVPGRGCSPLHTSSERLVLGYAINDDTLSCFMTNPSMPLSTIASPTYSGGSVLDPAIFDSPRFAYVPVLRVDPTRGFSDHYSIVEMRPCFITGEANNSTYNSETFVDGSAATTKNGLTIPTTKITAVQVFFFNIGALPNSGGNATPDVIIDPNGPLVPILTD